MKILSFWIKNELFGIDISFVKEINRNIEYTAVQRSPDMIVGLFNMRGQIVTIFNLAKLLGYDSEVNKTRATCIILKSNTGDPNQKGFIIDKTEDVMDLDEKYCEKPPANAGYNENKYVKLVVKLENDLLRVIGPDLIVNDLLFNPK